MERATCQPAFEQEKQEGLGEVGSDAWGPMASYEEDTQVRPSAPIKRKENWPFLFYMEGGRMYRNPAKRKRETYTDLGEALW